VAQAVGVVDLALVRVAKQPAASRLIGHSKARRAVPELGQILDDPSVAEGPWGQRSDASGVDEAEVHIFVVEADEEVAEVEVAMVQAGVVEPGGQISGRLEEAVKRRAGLDEFIGGRVPSEVLGDEEAASVMEFAPGDHGRGGDFGVLEHEDAVGLLLTWGRSVVSGAVSLDMEADGAAVGEDGIERAVLAFGDGPPGEDAGIGEDALDADQAEFAQQRLVLPRDAVE